MSNFTAIAIGNSLKKLLAEKPLKKITIQDIVDDCGINRNTFYYHFHDIPSLMETLLKEDFDNLVMENPDMDSIEDCLHVVFKFIKDNKTAALHIYKSLNRDIFEKYHWKICDYAATSFLSRKFKDSDISHEDKTYLTIYIKSLFFGIIIGWLERDLQDDYSPFINRMCQLKEGTLELMVENATKKK